MSNIEPCRDNEIALLANGFVCRGEQVDMHTATSLARLGLLENEEEEYAFLEHYREIAISLGRAGLLLRWGDDTETLF